MNSIRQIRQLYTPIQPAVIRSNHQVTYREHLPHDALQSFIYCYWELKTTKTLSSPFTYRVVTDGCIDVFFELSNASNSFVMGFCKKYTTFQLDNCFHYVGIRFLPTSFTQIFKTDASTLSNQFQPFNNIAPHTSNAIAINFYEGMCSDNIIHFLNEILLAKVETIFPEDDKRLYNAINIILDNYGVVNVKSDLNTGISHRQLQRLFKYYIGDTPKSFSKV